MLKNLITIRLKSFLSGMGNQLSSGKKSNKATGKSMYFIYALLIAVFAFYSGGLAMLVAEPLIKAGLDSVFFALFNIAAFGIVFILSIFETKSELFECKDNELLASMPVPPSAIVLSRTVVVIILNLIESGIMLLPPIVVYAIYGGDVLYVIGGVIAMLAITLLATALAGGIGFLLARLSGLFRHKSLITVILSLSFLFAYMFGYGYLLGFLETLEYDPEGIVGVLGEGLGGFAIVGECSALGSIPFFVFLGITVVLSAIFYFVISVNYDAVISYTGRFKSIKYTKSRLSAGSAFGALSRKELSRFFRTPMYLLNGGMGTIFTVVASVYILFNGENLRMLVEPLLMILGIDLQYGMGLFACVIVLLLESLNAASASALSLEGRSFWILKTSPTPMSVILHAKLVPHILITVPAGLLCSVIIGITMKLDPVSFILMLIISVVGGCLFALFGLIINVAFPKLEYDNEVAVMKNSAAMTISYLTSFAFSIAVFVLCIFAVRIISPLIVTVVLSVLTVLMCLGLYILFTGPTLRRAESL